MKPLLPGAEHTTNMSEQNFLPDVELDIDFTLLLDQIMETGNLDDNDVGNNAWDELSRTLLNPDDGDLNFGANLPNDNGYNILPHWIQVPIPVPEAMLSSENLSSLEMIYLGYRIKFTAWAKFKRQALAEEYPLGLRSYSKALYITHMSTNPNIIVVYRLEQQLIHEGQVQWIPNNGRTFSEAIAPLRTTTKRIS